MTRIKFSVSIGMVCLLVSACAGGNAIEEGVPSGALPATALAPLPPPAEPVVAGAEPAGTVTTVDAPQAAPVFPDRPGALSTPVATAPPADALVTGVAANTGTFPNSGIERQGATQQLTDAERDLKIAELQALQAQQQGNAVSPAEYRARLLELQRLAKTHSRDTIRAIEAQ